MSFFHPENDLPAGETPSHREGEETFLNVAQNFQKVCKHYDVTLKDKSQTVLAQDSVRIELWPPDGLPGEGWTKPTA